MYQYAGIPRCDLGGERRCVRTPHRARSRPDPGLGIRYGVHISRSFSFSPGPTKVAFPHCSHTIARGLRLGSLQYSHVRTLSSSPRPAPASLLYLLTRPRARRGLRVARRLIHAQGCHVACQAWRLVCARNPVSVCDEIEPRRVPECLVARAPPHKARRAATCRASNHRSASLHTATRRE